MHITFLEVRNKLQTPNLKLTIFMKWKTFDRSVCFFHATQACVSGDDYNRSFQANMTAVRVPLSSAQNSSVTKREREREREREGEGERERESPS